MFLTPRQQRILKAIVEDYVFTAEPVGSRTLSKKFDFGLSPATLRNEMADLEEGGFLRQPHTSAGRIPSDAGYRVFVDLLMEPAGSLPVEELRVLERFSIDARDLTDILQQTAKVTAVLTQCTAIVRPPRTHRSRIQFIQLLPLSAQDVMLVVLTDSGTTLNQLVRLPGPLADDELALLTNFLNAHLRHAPLDTLTSRRLEGLLREMAAYEQVLRHLWQRMQLAQEPDERVIISNASFLAQQPEFGDAGKLRSLLCLLEREEALASLLGLLNADRVAPVRVSIGHENPLADLHECSVVSAAYTIGDREVGEIAVLGPTRLAYARATLVVETMARQLSRVLTRTFTLGGGGAAER